MIPDWELPARRLYEWLSPHAQGFRVRWEDLTDAERLKYGHAAMRASLDAGNQQHWFHPPCWKRFVKYMNAPLTVRR